MSLILATGSSQGDSKAFLMLAQIELSKLFKLLGSSRIFKSKAQDYLYQPDFLNQLHEFEIPNINPQEALRLIQDLENKIGRVKTFDKGPRTIDIDIIFWGLDTIETENLIIPHPHWQNRSFIIRPLQDLPFFKLIENRFTIPKTFKADAFPV